MQRTFALPGTRPRYAPDRVVDVEHYRLELRVLPERRRIEGTCALTITTIQDAVRHLDLDAVELDLAEVRLDDGRQLAFGHDGRRLRIDFPRPLGPRERRTLTIRYSAEPRRGLWFVGPDAAYPQRPRQVWSQGQDEDSRYWFPCYDAPHMKSTSEVIATVPPSWFALSNGDLLDVRAGDGDKTYHWRFDVPHSCYLITLAAGELVELRDQWDDVDVRYYVAPGREDDARRTLGKTPRMLALFSERFGLKYPYRKYAQVCVADFIFGGMENTTATTLTETCLYDERAAIDYDVDALVAHELAHQWFGDLVTCREWGQGWLNEGFATYSEYVWREHADGRDEAALELLDWADQYFGEDSRRYRRPIVTNVYDEPIDIFDHHLYEKGGLVLHMLRRNLGDGPFWAAIAHYLGKHRTQTVETRDLARAVEAVTGRNLDWFFDQWVAKAGHPELKIEYGWDGDAKLARFTVKQTQKVEGDTPLFRLPLTVTFRVAGEDRTFPLDVKDVSEAFYFPLAEEPTQAIFDAGQHTLKSADIDKPKPLWLAELKSATEAIDRSAAARALGKHASFDVVAALAEALARDPFWGVRAAAATALGEMRTEAARDALIRALAATEHAKARRAVAKALGQFRHDDAAAAALEPLAAAGDPSYFVEAEACLALGRTRTARAPAALRLALQRDSYLDVVRQHAYRGLAEARDDSAIPILLDGTRYGKVSHGRRAAIHALAELAAGRQDREAREVRERIEELLDDPDFRVEQAALEGLAVLADWRALPALRRAVDRNLDGRIRRRGREIIRDLEEGRAREEGTRGLRDELEKLRRELTSLRERLGKIEAAPAPATKKGKPKPPARRGGAARKRR
ncbi:MAG TPA: M1 family aminopeptidase [Haliangiales bacterium]|nr:M1 family aminopeptidase [Haliangiales bacterium]